MTAGRVSVALGSRNGAVFIERQLESILAQTVPVDEIVLSDDASTDGTVEIALRVVGERLPIVILRNGQPLGVTRNFEQAILASSGDVIVLCDQDDVWRTDRIATMLRRFADDGRLSLVFSDARIVDADGIPTGDRLLELLEVGARERAALEEGRAVEVFLRRNIATGATVAFRRSLLDKASPFPENWVHDEWLAMVAALDGGIGLIDDALVDYRIHGSNQIGVRRPTLAVKIARILESRGDRNARLARRGRDLAEHSVSAHVVGAVRQAIMAKADFEEWRAALPRRRPARVGPVLVALVRGEYAAFASQGPLDAIRDLAQKA